MCSHVMDRECVCFFNWGDFDGSTMFVLIRTEPLFACETSFHATQSCFLTRLLFLDFSWPPAQLFFLLLVHLLLFLHLLRGYGSSTRAGTAELQVDPKAEMSNE